MYEEDGERFLRPAVVQLIAQEIERGYLRASYHPTIEGLRIYNYTPKTQFERHWTAVTMMCRGLVVDKNNRVVIHCPEKFFNEGEPDSPDTTNWVRTTILEKLDGYYISVRRDTEYGLIVTSRGSFENQYVDAAKKLLPPECCLKLDTDYFCELCQNFPGDEDIIVTQHPHKRLVLWSVNGIPPASSYEDYWFVAKTLTSNDVAQYMNENVEGVVVFDWDSTQRVKRKTQWYLDAHRVISGLTKKNVFDSWKEGKSLLDLEGVPEEHREKIAKWEEEFTQIYAGQYLFPAKTLYNQWKDKNDKDFALNCKDDKDIKTIVFAMRKGKDYHKIIYRIMRSRLTD